MKRPGIFFAALLAFAALAGCEDAQETSMLIQIESSTLVVPDQIDELCVQVWGEVSMNMVDGCFTIPSFPQSVVVRAVSDPNQGVRITVRGMRGGVEHIRAVAHSSFVEGQNVVVVVSLETDCLDVPCREGFGCERGRCMPGGDPDGGPMVECTTDADCPDDMIACRVERCV